MLLRGLVDFAGTSLREMIEHLPYLATAATVFAALVAYWMLRHQRFQEKNRISLLKLHSEIVGVYQSEFACIGANDHKEPSDAH